ICRTTATWRHVEEERKGSAHSAVPTGSSMGEGCGPPPWAPTGTLGAMHSVEKDNSNGRATSRCAGTQRPGLRATNSIPGMRLSRRSLFGDTSKKSERGLLTPLSQRVVAEKVSDQGSVHAVAGPQHHHADVVGVDDGH